MKPICIIPARSGSKGLRDKNMLFMDNQPMIFHTIQAALDSQLFDKESIIVSTDSDLYASICQTMGVKVVSRSPSLASDSATTFDLLEDFLIPYEEHQTFVLLQATSPLRTGQQIREAYALFNEGNCDHLVSVSKVEKSPILFSHLTSEGRLLDIIGIDKGYRRQDADLLYYPNGAIFISRKLHYLTDTSFFTGNTVAYVMSKESSIDVDDHTDFLHAIGQRFFDYQERERRNKNFYKAAFEQQVQTDAERVILGDSRMVNIGISTFVNYAQGGVTLATVVENLNLLMTEKVKQVFVSLGINDFIARYSSEEIKEHFSVLLEKLVDKQVFVTSIPLTLFRSEVNNAQVREINDWLASYCQEKSIAFLDMAPYLENEGNLAYSKTTDGLHFTEETNLMLSKLYDEFIQQSRFS